MSVVDEENKKMLFDLIVTIANDNQLKIDNNELYKFISDKCGYFHTKRFEFGKLSDINKRIVEQGYFYIMSNQSSDIKNERKQEVSRREIFDTNLSNHEQNFKKMINAKKPKEIDFSDNSKDFPIGNLNNIMNQTLADREKELTMITQKYQNNNKTDINKWLNREDENTPKIKIEKESNLKLDNTVNLNKNDKRVHFKINEKNEVNEVNEVNEINEINEVNEVNEVNEINKKTATLNNLFSKLKQKKPVSNDDIIERLDKIISNQEKFLELFSKFSENQRKLNAGSN